MIRQPLQLIYKSYPYVSYQAAISPPSNKQLSMHSISLYNGMSVALDIGAAIGFNSSGWKLWQITASATNVTSTIQAGTAVNLFDTTNNHGFIVQAKSQFSLVAMNISQVQSGSPVYTYEYYNGSSWSALSLKSSPVYTSTGNVVIAFLPPFDWVVGDNSAGTDSSMYSIRVLATTASGQAVKANYMALGQFLAFREHIAPQQALSINFNTMRDLLEGGSFILPYFSSASANNAIEAAYQVSS